MYEALLSELSDDDLAEKFASDIERGESPDAVSARLSGVSDAVRKKAFRVFLLLADRFGGDASVSDRLIAGAEGSWPYGAMVVAKRYHESNRMDRAKEVFDRIMARTDFATVGLAKFAGFIESFASIGSGRREMDAVHRELLSRIVPGITHIDASHITSAAHHYAASGEFERAEEVWGRLVKAWPSGAGKYVEFRKKFLPDESIVLPPDEAVEKSNDAELLVRRAKAMMHTEERWKVEDMCEASLHAEHGLEVVASWLNLTRDAVVLHGDQATCIALWERILDVHPEHADSYIRFSAKNISRRSDPYATALLKRARAMVAAQKAAKKNLPFRSTSVHLSKGSPIPADTESMSLAIGSVERSIHSWISIAGMHAANGESDEAFGIWVPVYAACQGMWPSIVRGMIRLRDANPGFDDKSVLRIPETIHANPDFARVYHSLAANLREGSPEAAHELLRVLAESSDHPYTTTSLSRSYLRRNDVERAVNGWLPLRHSHVDECAKFAVDLARYGHMHAAEVLFKRILERSPETGLRHFPGYILTSPFVHAEALGAFEAMLPATGNDRNDQTVWLLKILMKHRSGSAVRWCIERLKLDGALDDGEIRDVLLASRR